MVQLGDFSIQLVQPHSKQPFAEYHHSDGKTYVEIPRHGAEYLMAVSKPRAKLFKGTVVLRFYVDGTYLGFNLTYTAACKATTPKYKGHWQRDEHGVSTDTAIGFSSPERSKESCTRIKRFGRVKVKIFPAFVQKDAKTADNNHVENNGKLGYDKDCLLSTLTLYLGTRDDLLATGIIRETPAPPVPKPISAIKAATTTTTTTENNDQNKQLLYRLIPPKKVQGFMSVKSRIKSKDLSLSSSRQRGAMHGNTDNLNNVDEGPTMCLPSTPTETSATNADNNDDESDDDSSVVLVDADLDVMSFDDDEAFISGDDDEGCHQHGTTVVGLN